MYAVPADIQQFVLIFEVFLSAVSHHRLLVPNPDSKQDVQPLHLVAFECLHADVVQILADTLPWPALLHRQPQNLPLTRA